MPDRIIRQGILTSDRINSISWVSEVFYRRLMSVVDDFGRYDGRPSLLRASLYPLKLDKVSDSDIVKWMGDCSDAGLVRQYTVDGRDYIELLDFNQRLRTMKSRFPAPADIRGQLTADVRNPLTDDSNPRADVSNLLPETKRNETETNPILNPKIPEMTKKDFSLFQSQLIQDQLFTESIMMTRGIKDKQTLMNWIKVFNAHIAGESKTNKDYPDYKRHFKNWISKQNTTKPPEVLEIHGNRVESAREKKDRELQEEIYGKKQK